MTDKQIKTTLQNLKFTDPLMSIGFKRYFILPQKTKEQLKKLFESIEDGADFLTTQINYFERMSEQQFKDYLKSI